MWFYYEEIGYEYEPPECKKGNWFKGYYGGSGKIWW